MNVDTVRAHIEAGTCPFCPAGPFAMLPVHTAKVHGVDKWALRDLAHLAVTDPLCSQEARDKMRDAYEPHRGAQARAAARAHREAGTHAPPRRTRAGVERNTASIKAYMETQPEHYREALETAWERSAQARKKETT